MKKLKNIILICLIAFLTFCNAQNKVILEYQNDNLIKQIGIGLVQQVKANEKLTLYIDSDCNHIKTKDGKSGKDFIPLLYKIDYNILFFICLEKKEGCYKIAIDNNNSAYIKSSEKFIFYNWNDFLKEQVTSIESKNLKSNPFFDKFNGNPIQIKKLQTDDEVEVLEIKNDWLKIKNITINKNYWLKWKEKNNLLVYLNLLM